MISETIVAPLEDLTPCLNKEVFVTWTRGEMSYQGKGRIVALSPWTATIELLDQVDGNPGYSAGDLIKAPRHVYRERRMSSYSVRDIPNIPFVHKDFL